MNRTRLTLPILVFLIAAVVAVIVSTSGASTRKQPSVAAGSAVTVGQTALGGTLADAKGRTLYLFAPDKSNVSTLSVAGRAVWPPFTAATPPKATGGVAGAKIGTATGAGGVTQLAYNGHPLYYFVGDKAPGELTGQGLNEFGGRWYVLSASGAAITSAPKSVAPSAGSGSSYGSSYPY
jgi:predicted lipoprotein with Yx(FWY)xxD motif